MKDEQNFKLIIFSSFILFLAWIGISAYQGFTYLKTGSWEPMPMKLLLVTDNSAFGDWYRNPRSWLGLHEQVTSLLEYSISGYCFIGSMIGATVLLFSSMRRDLY
jgi:hypothetical protein